MRKPTTRSTIVLLAVVALFVSLIVALFAPRESVAAPRLRIPRAADAVDQAAGAFEGLCDEARDVIRDYRRQGKIDGAFGVYVLGIPLVTVEWQVNLPGE